MRRSKEVVQREVKRRDGHEGNNRRVTPRVHSQLTYPGTRARLRPESARLLPECRGKGARWAVGLVPK